MSANVLQQIHLAAFDDTDDSRFEDIDTVFRG
jgi:hypothetical protein